MQRKSEKRERDTGRYRDSEREIERERGRGSKRET